MAKQDKTGGGDSGKVQPKAAKAAGKAVDAEAPKTLGDRIAELKGFFESSQGELKKIVWPTRKETTATSLAVLIVVVVMSLFLGVVDSVLTKIIQAVLS